MARVLSTDQTEQKASRVPATTEPAALWTFVVALGIAISIVGWTDLVLLWFPLHFVSPEWRFGTISGHFDGMPLGTLGLTILAVGLLGKGWRIPALVMVTLLALVALDLLVISIIYLRDAPVALQSTPSEMQSVLKKAMLKAGVFAVTYTCFYAWLAWFLWQKTKVHKE